MSKVLFLLSIFVCTFSAMAQEPAVPDVTQGSLFAHGKKGNIRGECPLKSTSIRTDIAGFVARVRVRQEFENPFNEAIEAVYTFPLSQNGAVDDMTMTVGTRTIRAAIMKREEARRVYESAKEEGRSAALLDQERPNIFTQSVANIMPGEKIVVEISYVETLKYEDGAYEFVFPMTVGPRYSPGSVRDAAKIKPKYAKERPGHDISMEVNLNAGVPVQEIRSTSHEIKQTNLTASRAQIALKNESTIPNKDFVLRYDVTGGKIQDALLTHRGERGGFFTLLLQPPDRFTTGEITPKEIVFVLDTSGSMYGFPIEKAKEAMKLSLEGLHPNDTFNLITFAGDTSVLFPEPVPATQGNLERALAFLESRQGGGGTEMMKAIKASLDPTDSKEHLRIVCFMTDGYVGNEAEIIAEIQRHPNARVFSFGIGNSVNRYVLDKMAEAGNGEVEYVSLQDDGSKAAKKFYERVRTPLLTDITIDWNDLPVADVYPGKFGDLFSAKPLVITGRYSRGASGVIRIKGMMGGQEFVREVAVTLPESEASNDSLASVWARKRVDELMMRRGTDASKLADINTEITQLGLEFRIMTELTSFVAVEDRIVNQNGKPVTVQVPVAVPEGVDAETSGGGGGGGGGGFTYAPQIGLTPTVAVMGSRNRAPAKARVVSKGVVGQGIGYGSGQGDGNGSGRGSAGPPPPPPPPTETTANLLAMSPVAAEVVVAEDKPVVMKSQTERRTQMVKDKTHARVWNLIERSRKKFPASANESEFVRDGKASVSVTLAAVSPEILRKLHATGFEVVTEKGRVLKGTIAIEKLRALAEIDEVTVILPES